METKIQNTKTTVDEVFEQYDGLRIEELDGYRFLVGFENFEDLKDVEESTNGDAVLITEDYRRRCKVYETINSPAYDKANELVEDDNYLRVYYKPECTVDNIIEDAKADIAALIEDDDLDANKLFESIQEVKDTYQNLVEEFEFMDDDEVLVVGDTLSHSCIDKFKRFPMEWETTLHSMHYGVKIR